jgi:iron complex transport system substrate-binding protein
LHTFFSRHLFKLQFGVVFLFLFVFATTACRTEKTEPQNTLSNQEFTDDLGKKITLPNEITRAVSLAPNLTEIIFAVGAGEKLVGVTTYCNYPEEATKIQKIGDTLKPNIENIIALKPQIVFVSTASQLESFAATLEEQNIKVFITNPSNLEDVYKSIETIGSIFNNKKKALEITTDLKKRVTAVEEKTKGLERVKTFVQFDKNQLFTIGKKSFLTDIIEKAGGVSVTDDIEDAFPKISKEKALASNPDAIILSDSPENSQPNEAFVNSNAVRNKAVFAINADILSRPSPRLVEALEQIAGRLHPEKFE